MKQLKLLLITVIALWSCGIASAKIVNCYYGTWANYRTGDGKFDTSNINPNLCTHLSYSFFGITAGGEFRILDEWLDLDSGLGMITRTLALKQINPKLKVLAVVGGWNEGSINYSNMAADAGRRKLFITSTLNFIRKYGFDGLDLDWEYPAQRLGAPQDKQNFVTLLKELRAAFDPYNLELSIAVGASEDSARLSYDIPNISKYLNYINVMTYDFATHEDGVLGFNAPLKGQGKNNVQSAIQFWLQQGAPASKLVLGLAMYGRSYQLSNSQQISVGSPSSGAGSAGPITQQPGYLGYNEICGLVSSWNYKWAQDYGVPFIHNSNQWIGYDNVQSIELKMDLVQTYNLAGAMVWSIETDDFRGKCGEKYPLLNAINRKLGNGGGSVVPPVSPPVSPPVVPVDPVEPSVPSVPGKCSADGFFGVAGDCTKFYQCSGGVRYDFSCSPGLLFDVASSNCNWPNLAKCQK